MAREFKLSPVGSGHGVSCDANGAFVDFVPLLKRVYESGRGVWKRRSCEELSDEIGLNWDLPFDIRSRTEGLNTIARALNEGDVARAQIAAVLLAIPEPPSLEKRASSHSARIKFIRDLHEGDLIKADWDSDEHPRWPAGTPDGRGGEFAPKGEGAAFQSYSPVRSNSEETTFADESKHDNSLIPVVANFRERPRTPEECDKILDSDMYVCGSLRDKRDYIACKASAAERYAACLRGKPLPPLTLPHPEYDFHPLPTPPPTHRWPSSPPLWLPFIFVPWFFGIPA